jgi:hypothetical protein
MVLVVIVLCFSVNGDRKYIDGLEYASGSRNEVKSHARLECYGLIMDVLLFRSTAAATHEGQLLAHCGLNSGFNQL